MGGYVKSRTKFWISFCVAFLVSQSFFMAAHAFKEPMLILVSIAIFAVGMFWAHKKGWTP